MASYFSGMIKSMKGLLGFEGLEVEAAGNDEDKVQNANTEERQSLWKQLSQYIGKDVTSMISLPVWIFEPISFLQIMAEPMEHAELLLKASESPDPTNRMAYLVAFIAGGYSCAVRSKKAFNPLLGETFEFIPADKKWKFFAEQVSHHPPIGVAEVSNDNFVLGLEMEMKTKFRGNSIDVSVLGSNRFSTKKYGDYITWGHMDTCAHNVIIGGMWVDHFGTLEITNHTTGDRAILTFNKCGWLGAGRFTLTAEIYDKENVLKMKLSGTWNGQIVAVKIGKDGTESAPILLWKKPAKVPDNKWNWSPFVFLLNEMDDQYRAILPPTDSRLRGDRYSLEKGDIELAGKEKLRLEEKQRSERKAREASGEHYDPQYYQKVDDEKWGHKWVYKGGYWEAREERLQNVGNGTTTTTTTATEPSTTSTESTTTSSPSAETETTSNAEQKE